MNLLNLFCFSAVTAFAIAGTIPSNATITPAVTAEDIKQLQSFLRTYVYENQDQIPVLVRMSFHDLMNYDPKAQKSSSSIALIQLGNGRLNMNSTDIVLKKRQQGGAHGCMVDDPNVIQ